MPSPEASAHLVRADQSHIDILEELEKAIFPHNCFGPCLIEAEMAEGEYFILLLDNLPAAYVLVRRTEGIADILRFGVLEEYRRQGWGRYLLQLVLGMLDTQNTESVMLTVRKGNNPAIALYKSFGFKVVGCSISYWMMQRGYMGRDVDRAPQDGQAKVS